MLPTQLLIKMPVTVQVTRHIPYTDDRSNPKLQLDLYGNVSGKGNAAASASQSSASALPLIVYIHGGLWADGDKNAHCNIGLTLAERCNAHVATINYRLLKTDKVHWPVYIHDVIHALLWLQQQKNLEPFGLNVSTTLLVGHSVGASMAALIAMTDDVRPSDVRAETMHSLQASISGIVCLQGMFDLTAYVERFANWASAVTGPLTEDKSTWQEPQKYIQQLAESKSGNETKQSAIVNAHLRWLILHSPDDEWVNTEQSTDFADQLSKVYGAHAVTLHTDITGGHHDVVKNIGMVNDKATELTCKFIASVASSSS